jgi:hypothetical protein
VVAFRITEPGLVFYCRRPVQWVWSPEELGPVVQQGSLLLMNTVDSLSGVTEQRIRVALKLSRRASGYPLRDSKQFMLGQACPERSRNLT